MVAGKVWLVQLVLVVAPGVAVIRKGVDVLLMSLLILSVLDKLYQRNCKARFLILRLNLTYG